MNKPGNFLDINAIQKKIVTLIGSEIKKALEANSSNPPEIILRNEFDIISERIIFICDQIFQDEKVKLINTIEDNTIDVDEQIERSVCLYLELLRYQNTIHLSDFESEHPKNTEYNSAKVISYLLKVANQLRYRKLILPMVVYLEQHYIDIFAKRSIYPYPVRELMIALASDDFKLNFNDQRSKEAILSYCGYTDPDHYKNVLSNLYENFFEYALKIRTEIKNKNQLEIYYIHLSESLNLLKNIYKRGNSVSFNKVPKMVRKDTDSLIALELAKIPREKTYNISTYEIYTMMDLQYNTILITSNFVSSEVNILQRSINLRSLENDSIYLRKIIVNLGVEKLAFLIRVLQEEKIINERVIVDLIRKISGSFQTLNNKSLSFESTRNKYYTCNEKTADYWVKKFTHMKQRAMLVRDNGGWGK